MSQVFSQLCEKIGEFDFDVSHLGGRELKLVAGVVILVPLTYYTVEACRILWKIRCVGKRVDQIPGPPASFFTGNLLQHPGIDESRFQYDLDLATKYKTCHRFWFGPFRPNIVVYHPSTVREILKTSEGKQLSLGGGYCVLLPWLGSGLLTSRGNLWARNRRLLTPGFHFDVLKPYVQVYNNAADKLLDIIEKKKKEGSVEIFEVMSLVTLDTVLKCAFSYDENILDVGEKHPYVAAVNEITRLSVKRAFNLLHHISFIYNRTADSKIYYKNVNYVHGVAEEVIRKRKKALADGGEEKKKKYLDFLDILLSARDTDGKGLTDKEIRQEVDTFLFGGHDTTASSICWTLYALAEHPEIQERARQEINGVLENKEDEALEWDDLGKLQYLTQCLKEALRLHFPVPFIGRELSQELTIDGVTLLPGTLIDINICTLHHNPHVWGENHNEYIPDRFSPENSRKMDPYAFIPFSAGPRNCIGQNFAMGEMKVIIAKILHRFKITVDESHPLVKVPDMVMRAKGGIKLNFTSV